MEPLSASTQIVVTVQSPDEESTHLRGRWLLLVRVVWVTIAALALGLYVATIPIYFAFLHVLCTGTRTACWTNGQITPNDLREFQTWGLSLDFFALYGVALYIIFVVVFVTVGVVVFWCKSDDRMALFASFILVTFPCGHSNVLMLLPSALLLPNRFVAFLGTSSLSLFFYLFPTGQFVPRWTRWLSIGVIGLWAVYAFFPSLYLNTSIFVVVAFLGFVCSALAAQIYRYRWVSSAIQRQQTKWVVFGISIGLSAFLILYIFWVFFPALFGQSPFAILIIGAILYLCFMLVPLSIGVAILRSHLFDIDLIINRTLVYGILTVSVVGIYILVVVSLGVLFQASGSLLISLVTTGVIASLFQPLREWLQRAINRLTYGDRADPYRILSQLGKRLEATLIPDAILPTVVETVAQALKIPYVAIELKEGEQFRQVATYGIPVSPSLHIPLLYQQETIGRLLLAARSLGKSFTSADRRLLDDLARQAGIAAHTVRLSADLQRSRERLLLAQEEERRRLARELHDSVSQALYGISLGAHTARVALDRDPSQVAEPLDYVLSLTEAAMVEMRALIFELRPESLEAEGLVLALTKQAAALYTRHNLLVSTELCAEPDLPLMVKQGLYRIAQEALHNAVKHARASKVNLRLEQTAEGNVLEIHDDGVGFDTTASFPGHLGLQSMRERVVNMGGTFEIESAPSAGTRICVRIPGGV